jgi:uncharacterized protein (TIGR00661 family)
MKRVLVTPLDWGLGHATRCVPVIRAFISRDCEVMLAGSGDSLRLLQKEFPSLKSFSIPGYNPVYPQHGSMVWAMAKQLPKFMRTIREEHRVVESIVRENAVELVVSDNRYGAWSSEVPCIFITHQSNIQMPKRFGWLQEWVRKTNYRYMRRFTRCWIPDWPGAESLAGKLARFEEQDARVQADFIGALSRFSPRNVDGDFKYDVVAMFSGPEPQRSVLERIVWPQLKASGLRYFVVRGVINDVPISEPNQVNFLTSNDLQEVIGSSRVVVARSGYSTVMDLAMLEKNAIFIPTPGQTEQEYLAAQLMASGWAYSTTQDKFDLSQALRQMEKFSGLKRTLLGKDLLSAAVDHARTLK